MKTQVNSDYSDPPTSIDIHGDKTWRNSAGQYHRTDGPAVEWADGYKEWWINGKCHRTDGPAVEYPDGNKSWWVNGELLGYNKEGFWRLWEILTSEEKCNFTLLTYLPEKF